MKFSCVWLALILSCQIYSSAGAKVAFKLSARNLPGKTDPFAEVRTLGNKTSTIDLEQNPNWSDTFRFDTSSYSQIEIEVRDNEDAGKDKSLGWARISSPEFIEKRTFHVGLWTDDDKQIYMGTLRVTVE